MQPAVASAPHAAPRGADVNDLGVVRIDGDGRNLAVDIDVRLEGARTNRCPDGSVEAHGNSSGYLSSFDSAGDSGLVSGAAGGLPGTGSVGGLTTEPGS